ncbi:MAG: type IV secretory system conjugative DNA transfer family protein, partial [Deltaproteobacteria bacterium]|nr:type IV secretory system conjugative DNA transfer family protein [Deltaproteobacteria bacterium]
DKGYGPDETVSSNCHIQNAYPPNKPATAEHLSKLTGQTTVVKESIQTSGKLFGTFHGQVSKSMQEVQRPLLTPDECLRMQGPKKDEDGMIKEAGDMLISVAGYPIIYGKQPLYFQDEVLTTRSEVPPPDDTDVTVKVVEQKEISLRDKAQATCEAAH